MVARSEEYYLRTVARGREEYYTGSGESPGTWVGEGSRLLGLEGEVDPDHLRAVLAGASPEGEILVASRLPDSRRICGFDLTFSAPKSVSLLYGLSEPDVSAAVRVAHQEAMADALGYLERHALRLRRGSDGARSHRRRRSRGGCLRAPDLESGGPPAPHPRAGGQRGPGERRRLVRTRRPALLLPRPHRRVRLPGGAPPPPERGPRGPLRAGPPRHGRARRRSQGSPPRLFHPPARDRAPAGSDRVDFGPRRRGRRARHSFGQGADHAGRAERAGTARALARASWASSE